MEGVAMVMNAQTHIIYREFGDDKIWWNCKNLYLARLNLIDLAHVLLPHAL